MSMNIYHPNFASAINNTRAHLFNYGNKVTSYTWQGIKRQEDMWELLEWSFQCPMNVSIEDAAEMIKPNLPWADLQFYERAGGSPLNPGESYKEWPMYKNNRGNDKFRKEEIFDHTYMERIWPKEAGNQERYMKAAHGEAIERSFASFEIGKVNKGIRFEYGDLNDVIGLLRREPTTRQAYLPIWFPEDTGNNHNGRVPCTLGYLFYIRNNYLHCTYYIRACDYFRHFRDDVYLSYRLAVHICCELNNPQIEQPLAGLKLGNLTMHIASLHVFYKELKLLRDELQ
jgi:hypothetical protein